MPLRSRRLESLPPELAADLLRAAGAFRAAVIRGLLARVRPFGPSKAGLALLDAIDLLAESLTGNRAYFHIDGSCPNKDQKPD